MESAAIAPTPSVGPFQRILFKLWATVPMLEAAVEPLLRSATMTATLPQHTLVVIDPRSIQQRLLKPSGGWRHQSLRFFWDDQGAWRTEPFRETLQYRLIDEIWSFRNKLEQSPPWERLMKQIHEGRPFVRRGARYFVVDTPAKVRDFLYGYRDILEDVGANGFKPEKGEEMGVAIGADGNFLKISGGKHRTAIAQILGVPTIPVRIKFAHRAWWRRQREAFGGSSCHALQQALARLGN
jgi:hypothetical protein